ncbi:hypothetical protein [Pararhizobium sp. PWRC1-1]|uniref:hypothetical protein n=1 Tax=Pararhizobium sp. PWRC1-1 TaxID=2804566 RepID=UPI003CEF6F73
MKYTLLLITSLFTAIPVWASDGWTSYANPRFDYSAEVPPGFKLTQESDNGDGATFESKDGTRLLIFGAFVEDGAFAADIRQRIVWDNQKGWQITYEKVTPGWASYSGARGADILYSRAVALCDGSAAYFQLIYPRKALKAYNGLVGRMVKSLRPATGRYQAPTSAPAAAPN